jgi:hypothetical protein
MKPGHRPHRLLLEAKAAPHADWRNRPSLLLLVLGENIGRRFRARVMYVSGRLIIELARFV